MECELQDDCEVAYVKEGEHQRLAKKNEECNNSSVKENCSVYKSKIETNLKK